MTMYRYGYRYRHRNEVILEEAMMRSSCSNVARTRFHLGLDIRCKGCEEKHSRTAAHHPVVKPPAVVSTAVSHTQTQQQGWGNY